MERGLPVELLYVLGFVALVLFNIMAQRAARRRQAEEAQAQAEAAPAPSPDEPLEDIWGRAPVAQPAAAPLIASRPAPALLHAEAPRRAHPVRALLKDKRDLRRAVILAMVLGPCRAQEPPDRPAGR